MSAVAHAIPVYNPTEFVNLYDQVDLDRAYSTYGVDDGSTPELKRRFLEHLRAGSSPTGAVRKIREDNYGLKLTRAIVYAWRKDDDSFRRDWDEAYSEATEIIEDKMTELAMDGNSSMISQALKVRHPTRYATTRQEISGVGGAPIQTSAKLDLASLSQEERNLLRTLIEKQEGAEAI